MIEKDSYHHVFSEKDIVERVNSNILSFASGSKKLYRDVTLLAQHRIQTLCMFEFCQNIAQLAYSDPQATLATFRVCRCGKNHLIASYLSGVHRVDLCNFDYNTGELAEYLPDGRLGEPQR